MGPRAPAVEVLCSLLLVLAASQSPAQEAAAGTSLPPADSVRIAEAFRLVRDLGDRIWPGLEATPMPLLLLTDSAELLVTGNPSRAARMVSTRPRRFPPTMLATFPIDGLATIVIGTPERTGKSPTEWVLTLIHEHFHQWQYARPNYYAGVARLNLSHGDTTGMWMLNYPFPYDSAPVAAGLRRLASSLRSALATPRSSRALEQVVLARDALRSRLSPPDYRYFEFQLWQEGVARFVEYRAADVAATQGSSSSEGYRAAAERGRRDLVSELQRVNPERDRRVSFYPIGAAIALLLEASNPGWKRSYTEHPFELSTLLAGRKVVPPSSDSAWWLWPNASWSCSLRRDVGMAAGRHES